MGIEWAKAVVHYHGGTIQWHTPSDYSETLGTGVTIVLPASNLIFKETNDLFPIKTQQRAALEKNIQTILKWLVERQAIPDDYDLLWVMGSKFTRVAEEAAQQWHKKHTNVLITGGVGRETASMDDLIRQGWLPDGTLTRLNVIFDRLAKIKKTKGNEALWKEIEKLFNIYRGRDREKLDNPYRDSEQKTWQQSYQGAFTARKVEAIMSGIVTIEEVVVDKLLDKDTRYKTLLPEGILYYAVLEVLGVDPHSIYVDAQSTTSVENIIYGAGILKKDNLRPKTVLLFQEPYIQRRAKATFKKQMPKYYPEWNKPGHCVISYAPYLYEGERALALMTDEELTHMAELAKGEIRRFLEYSHPPKDAIVAEVIPEKVMEAYGELLKRALLSQIEMNANVKKILKARLGRKGKLTQELKSLDTSDVELFLTHLNLKAIYQDREIDSVLSDQERCALLSRALAVSLTREDAGDIARFLETFIKEQSDAILPEAKLFIRSYLTVFNIDAPLEVAICTSLYNTQKEHSRPPSGRDWLRIKVEQFFRELLSVNPKVQGMYVFVNDGDDSNESGRKTSDVLRSLLEDDYYSDIKDRVSVLELSEEDKQRMGSVKHGALACGMRYALNKGADIIMYSDGDLSAPLGQLGLHIESLVNKGKGLAYGSIKEKGSVVPYRKSVRRLGTIVYNWWVRLLHRHIHGIKDTQRAFKAFRREALEKISPVEIKSIDEQGRLKIEFDPDFLYDFTGDTEWLRRTRLAGYELEAIPIVWIDSPETSSISFWKSAVSMFISAVRQTRTLGRITRTSLKTTLREEEDNKAGSLGRNSMLGEVPLNIDPSDKPEKEPLTNLSPIDRKILNAIKALQQRGEPVTQTSIAEEAGLSNATITSRKNANPEIRTAIKKALLLPSGGVPAEDEKLKDEAGIVIGVTGLTQDEINARTDMKKIGGVKFVALNGKTAAENLENLREKITEYGAFNAAIIQGVDNDRLENAMYKIIDAIEEEDVYRFIDNPEGAALYENIAENIGETLEKVKTRKDIRDLLMRLAVRFRVIKSERLASLSIYEYKFDRIAGLNSIRSKDAGLNAKISEINGIRPLSQRVNDIGDLRWVVNEHAEASGEYGENYPVKLHIRLSGEYRKKLAKHGIKKNNFTEYLKRAKLLDKTKKYNIAISWNDSDKLDEIYDDIVKYFGEIRPENVAIGDMRAERRLTLTDKRKDIRGMIVVSMEEGIISQQYRIIIEIIANKGKKPGTLPEGVILEERPDIIPGTIYFRFKAIEPADMEKLRREIEQYEKILMAA